MSTTNKGYKKLVIGLTVCIVAVVAVITFLCMFADHEEGAFMKLKTAFSFSDSDTLPTAYSPAGQKSLVIYEQADSESTEKHQVVYPDGYTYVITDGETVYVAIG